MGEIYSITCRNKACRYHKELRSGVGMVGFAWMKRYERDILAGKVQNEVAIESINKGAQISAYGIYLCPQCKDFVMDGTYYLIENLTYSPYVTPRYDVTFPFGEPHCSHCGSKLEYIRNVLSSKVKCPQCNGELKQKLAGHFD